MKAPLLVLCLALACEPAADPNAAPDQTATPDPQPAPMTTLPAPDALPVQPDLPDPMKAFDGSTVETPDQWFTQRRPELKQLFQHYVYGYLPPPPGITSTLTHTIDSVAGGLATMNEVEIRFDGLPEDAPRIRLAVFIPRAIEGPAPVFLAPNKCGNHTVLPDETIPIHEKPWLHEGCETPQDSARGAQADYWALPYVLERGYAFATFHVGDIDPDRDDFTDGIHPYYQDVPGPDSARWGTIAAWAWGLHRAVDYLSTDPTIDRNRIAVIGHSRRGKTALLAAALDERIALVVPHQSGTGGVALSRDNDQETVARINEVFPHWFNDVFPQFGDGNEARLPVDQHLLVALVAPRPLLDTGGLQDTWANFEHALRALQAAYPVYQFLGVEGPAEVPVVQGNEAIGPEHGPLVQYRLDTEHTLNADYWRAILDFADARLPTPQPAP